MYPQFLRDERAVPACRETLGRVHPQPLARHLPLGREPTALLQHLHQAGRSRERLPKGSRLETYNKSVTVKEDYGTEKDQQVQVLELCRNVGNPQLIEIVFTLGLPGDDPPAWAAVAQQHRCAAAHFADPLILSGVLYLAKQLGESVLPAHEVDPIDEAKD
ncbi:RNaseH domain-containing protein [Actinospica robiniae]|uniref:RNaseH domain-containing protein n=1 Tax=Actinospica robiniae TaxID=304901 RepID=UPI0003FF7480